MDKIYEEKGLMLRQAFAELPLDVQFKLKSYALVLETTKEAVLLYAILEGYKAVDDLIMNVEDDQEEED
ncbi:MAG: hypothetical protein JNL36_07770 [Candidatus Kapabacteria bacterium]|nr:hypothetical protein [Candidatus Kapabacteria bacterium]